MMTMKRFACLTAALLAMIGCDPKSDGIKGITAPTGFAVTHSDYDAAGAIALLAPDGALEQERFIHSGTVFDGLGAALSSDIVLPTVASEAGVLTYIERLGADMITRIDIAAGEVLGQISAQDGSTATYRANAYDYAMVDAEHAWISRNSPNTEVDNNNANGGTDLVLLDLANNEIGDGRIDLSAMNGTATVTDFDTGEESEVVVYARPARMAKAGGALVVGLDRISLDYEAIGSGMVAIANIAEQTAEALALEGMSNCGYVEPVIDDESRVIVTCVGSFLAVERDEAGHAIVHIDESGEATIEHVWAAADHADDALATSNVVSIGGTRVVAIAPGNSYATPPTVDHAYVLDIESGDIEEFADAEGAYVLGAGAYNAATKMLLLPDASEDTNGVVTAGLRRFQWDAAGDISELDIVVTDSDLPPRTVRALR